MEQQYTFVRETRMYHADKDTIDLLKAAQKWDAGETPGGIGYVGHRSLADMVFEHGRETGRIGEGSAMALGQKRAESVGQ